MTVWTAGAPEPLAASGRAGRYDADFDPIASVTRQRCEWIVPAGGTH